MGLGSKLPCASTDACFSSVAPGLASTKSGGRAPAMAHRHDMAILKSSASYFYRGDRSSRGEGYKLIFSPFFRNEDPPAQLLDGQTEQSKEKEKEATWKTESWRSLHQAMACHRLINDSSVLASPQLHCSQALHWALTSLPLTTQNFSLMRATLRCWKQKTEHKKTAANRRKLYESKHHQTTKHFVMQQRGI